MFIVCTLNPYFEIIFPEGAQSMDFSKKKDISKFEQIVFFGNQHSWQIQFQSVKGGGGEGKQANEN